MYRYVVHVEGKALSHPYHNEIQKCDSYYIY